MSEPVAKIDTRFSEPGANPTPWPQTRTALEEAELFWITTVRADGRPHVTPLVGVWLDEALYFCTGEAEQKARNLSANSHVVLTTGSNNWDGGVDITVEGDAVRVTDNDLLERLAQAWAAKWDGRWEYTAKDGDFYHEFGGPVFVYAVAPAKVLAFGKGPFTHTSYRF